MNRVFLLLFFLVITVSLEAYSKKVILASFSTEQRAQNMLKELPKLSPTVFTLSKKYHFELKIRKSGKYHILVAEVFHNKKVLETFLKQIRKRFKGAYVSNHTLKIKKKKPKSIEKPKVIEEKIIIEKPKLPKKIIIQKKLEVVKQKKTLQVPEVKVKKETIVKEEEIQNNDYSVVITQLELQTQRFQTQTAPVVDFFQKYFDWMYFILFIAVSMFVHFYIKFKRIYDEY